MFLKKDPVGPEKQPIMLPLYLWSRSQSAFQVCRYSRKHFNCLTKDEHIWESHVFTQWSHQRKHCSIQSTSDWVSLLFYWERQTQTLCDEWPNWKGIKAVSCSFRSNIEEKNTNDEHIWQHSSNNKQINLRGVIEKLWAWPRRNQNWVNTII